MRAKMLRHLRIASIQLSFSFLSGLLLDVSAPELDTNPLGHIEGGFGYTRNTYSRGRAMIHSREIYAGAEKMSSCSSSQLNYIWY